MPPLSAHLHLYCERTQDGLGGEPVNAMSNIGFFIAAFLLLRLYRTQKTLFGTMPDVVILIWLTVAVGTGSLIFHTVATMWSALFDIIPIAFFIFFYLYVFSRTILRFRMRGAWVMFLLLAVFNITYKYYVFRAMDGYVSYIPTFFFLALLTLHLLIQRHPASMQIFAATALALLSLYCRTIDRSICGELPIGTHFLWHGINAMVMYILVKAIITQHVRNRTDHNALASSHKYSEPNINARKG
jgi:hypothetical protein